jgi:hypothetical protein
MIGATVLEPSTFTVPLSCADALPPVAQAIHAASRADPVRNVNRLREFTVADPNRIDRTRIIPL